MITPLGIKVLDFGLAKFTRKAERAALTLAASSSGIVLGTPAYMSPEQARGEPLDGRSDIFSLGCVLYQALTGRRAFGGASVMAILHEVATSTPPPPSALRPEIGMGWNLLLERALAKNKEGRFGSAYEMVQALEDIRSAPLSAAQRPVDHEPPLVVGREKELHSLDELLRRALGGAGKVVLLSGEAGIGKNIARRVLPVLHAAKSSGCDGGPRRMH